jgi:outer membrane lipoprotein carrier protein
MRLAHRPGVAAPPSRPWGARRWALLAALLLSAAAAAGAARAAAAATANGTSAASVTGSRVTALDRFLDGLRSLRTQFTQTVSDAHGNPVDAGVGILIVQRPGKFRWDYRARDSDAAGGPGAASAGARAAPSSTSDEQGQLLVADGSNLWFYDRELAQVTVKPISAALSGTPVMLLSGSSEQLRDSFDITAAAAHDGLEWVSVKPRDPAADFSHAQLGFAHDQLVRMLVNDRLGQTVQLDFSHLERNVAIDPAQLQFKPPAGVDVIGSPPPGS